MATIHLPLRPTAPRRPPTDPPSPHARIALVGNPNAGKTTLFNALTGLRAHTANFPGTTIERRTGRCTLAHQRAELIDLPGLYSLDTDQLEERLARNVLLGEHPGQPPIRAVLLVLDATNLCRHLFLARQVIAMGRPTVVALTMTDLARRAGTGIDSRQLAEQLGCDVVAVSAFTGEGLDDLREALGRVIADAPSSIEPAAPQREPMTAPSPTSAPSPTGADAPCTLACSRCPYAASFDWAERVGAACQRAPAGDDHHAPRRDVTDRLDRVLTQPAVGVAIFAAVMLAVFTGIFWLAQIPMGWIDTGFAALGAAVEAAMPAGDGRDLLVHGIIGGVGGVLVFLPQIAILFFALSLLEDTGYLARVALVMDRLMRRVGLPGKALVPLLSAHACAIPAIMASRVIERRRDRLVTIMVAPLLSCSARVPVYAMIAALLFPHRPLHAALLFVAAYGLGGVAAIGAAMLLRRTVLRGDSAPLLIELPRYRWPSLRNALLLTWDRAGLFVRRAGTVILLASMALWALATYPKADPPAEAIAMQAQAEALADAGRGAEAEALAAEADALASRHALAHSFAGRLGQVMEPAIRPLGFDEHIGVGLISSLAAREMIVSTLTVLYGVSEDDPGTSSSLHAALRAAEHEDGRPVFTIAASLSLLVFFVLAMQCIATLAVTWRETGSWRWPALQFTGMTVLAYVAALVTYQVAALCGLA